MNKVSISAISLALSLAMSGAQAGDSTFLITSGKNNYWKTGTFTEVTGNATITVDENQKKQKWRGFGGTFNEAGWDALNVLSESEKNRALRLLFDVNDGIGFTWGRIPVGASDYALERYSLNETPDDFEMKNFTIERDEKYLIPYIKAALEIKPDMRFWASPWSPPKWMKKNNDYDGGEMRNEPKYLQANALYLAKFCEKYNSIGIRIHAICPQNEPGYTQGYPSCGWGKYALPNGNAAGSGEFLGDFVKNYFVPEIEKLDPKVEVWFGTLSNDNYALDYWNSARDKAGSKIKAVGLQWNCRKYVKNILSAGDYIVLNSEHKCGNYPWLNAKANSVEDANRNNFLASMAPNNHAYGEESWDELKDWIREGVHSYNAWNMVLDTKGFNLDTQRKWPQNALLAVDRDKKTLNVTPAYYVFRHLAQYVDTGAIFLGTQGGDALSFLNPNGSIVTAAFNSNNNDAQTIVSVSGKKYQFTIPGRGWATLVVNWEKPVSVKETASNKNVGKANRLRVDRNVNGYRVTLPSREAGRIELLTASGRILESREIPQGSSEITFQKQTSYSGLLLLRAVNGGKTSTAKFFAF